MKYFTFNNNYSSEDCCFLRVKVCLTIADNFSFKNLGLSNLSVFIVDFTGYC